MNTRKRIELAYPHNGVRAVAELLDEFAPKTCAAMWGAFEKPARGKVRHAKYVGCEVLLEIPQENRTFEPTSVPVFPLGSGENLTWLPVPGDILWGYFPPYYLHGRPAALWELVIIYGRDSLILIEAGIIPLNHFAVITENLETFAQTCESVLVDGTKELVVRRLGG